jgi:iron complex transport system substrate-binding protein
VTIERKPIRIISLSPSLTETLFAIGARYQVVAVDQYSNYPAGTPRTTLDGFRLNIEAVAAYKPDLVLLPRGTDLAISSLRKLGIEVLVEQSAVDVADALDQMRDLGLATGRRANAERLIADVQAKLAKIAASVARPKPPRTYYWEVGASRYAASADTFVGKLLASVGLKNVVKTRAGAYPQVSDEMVIAKDPDYIFLADAGGVTVKEAQNRPGWNVLTGRFVRIDEDIASRWGPRIVDLLQAVADVLPKAK